MLNYYPFFKAFHIIGFVTWFAGLFYLVRMFVYHAEADQKPKELQADWRAQFTLMQWRVYKIISTPAMVITWLFGLLMLFTNPSILDQTWIKIKLVLLVLLVGYHFYCKSIIIKQEKGEDKAGSFNYRLLNELPTLFLVAIVLLAVVRDFLDFLKLFGGIMAFGVVLFIFAKQYKKKRESK
jgi:protoporphyrinogen IX oxidase